MDMNSARTAGCRAPMASARAVSGPHKGVLVQS